MKRKSFSHMPCPIARSLEVIGDAWTLLIVRDLYFGLCSFDEILENTGIARNILSARLRKLEDDGILQKSDDPEDGRRRVYRLTPKGKDLWLVLVALMQWGDRWEAPESGPIAELYERNSGRKVPPLEIRNASGDVLTPRDVSLRTSPGDSKNEPGSKRPDRSAEAASK